MTARNPQRAPAAAGLAGTGEKTARPAPARLQVFTLVLRALVEAGVVAGFAWWGYRVGAATGMKILLAAGAPALGFGFWGAVDFRRAGRLAEPLRLLQELAISALAAAALYAAGQHLLGWALGLLTAAYHALVYLQGGRLLKPRPGPPAPAAPAPGAPAALTRPAPDRAGLGEPASSRDSDAL
jgi:hypothetical protein